LGEIRSHSSAVSDSGNSVCPNRSSDKRGLTGSWAFSMPSQDGCRFKWLYYCKNSIQLQNCKRLFAVLKGVFEKMRYKSFVRHSSRRGFALLTVVFVRQ